MSEQSTHAESSRVAVVTGAAGGLGGACTRLLGQRGYRVVGVDVREEDLALVEIPEDEDGARLLRVVADLSDPEECERVIATAIAELGRVDVLVNSAAILARVEFADITPERFDHVMHTNTLAPLVLARAAMRDMATRGWGRVINVTASTAYDGGVKVSSLLYDISKGAVMLLTKMLAKYGAEHGILVNTVSPGAMDTSMMVVESQEILERHVRSIPLQRIADPHEVAYAIAWLVSDEASYVTGAAIDVNGGRVMR